MDSRHGAQNRESEHPVEPSPESDGVVAEQSTASHGEVTAPQPAAERVRALSARARSRYAELLERLAR